MPRARNKIPKSTLAVRTERWKIMLLRDYATEKGIKLQDTISRYVDMRATKLLERRGLTVDEAIELASEKD